MRNHETPSSRDNHHTFQGDEKRLVAECLAVAAISFAELVDSVAASGEDQDRCGGQEAAEDVELGWEVDGFPNAAAPEEVVGGDGAEDD